MIRFMNVSRSALLAGLLTPAFASAQEPAPAEPAAQVEREVVITEGKPIVGETAVIGEGVPTLTETSVITDDLIGGEEKSDGNTETKTGTVRRYVRRLEGPNSHANLLG